MFRGLVCIRFLEILKSELRARGELKRGEASLRTTLLVQERLFASLCLP